MELKINDTVVVDGKTAKVQSCWGAGAHKIFKLDDGREIMDLDKAVKNGSVVVTTAADRVVHLPTPVIKHPWRKD